MTFDRLIYIDRLKEAGVDETVARAHAEALREALFETVATKSDLNELATALKSDLNELATALKSDLHEQATALKSDLHEQATAFDRKIEGLDRKIEITARDLTIKGAVGLSAIGTLLVGLKIFG